MTTPQHANRAGMIASAKARPAAEKLRATAARLLARVCLVATVLASVVFLPTLLACGNDEPPGQHGRAEEAPRPRPVAPDRLFKRSRPMMGTIFIVSVAGIGDDEAEPVVGAALEEIGRLESVLSEWLPESEISRINAAAGEHSVAVGPDTMAVVQAGVDIGRISDGAFDLTWAALRGLYQFQPGDNRVPNRREIQERLPFIDYRDIVIDREANTVFLRRRGMAIGTGGIAKGYALDRAARVLEEAGIQNYMLFGGGQVQVHGKRGDRPWRVGIQHPRRSDYFAFLEVTGGSISTSGDYEHFFIDEQGKRWHHILDPRTGLPVGGTLSVTVLAQNGIYADALSTAVFVAGRERALAMLPNVPGGAEAVIVTDGFELVTTPGARERLHMTTTPVDGVLPH